MTNVLTIVGLPGSGKSRLITTLFDENVLPDPLKWKWLDDFDVNADQHWKNFCSVVRNDNNVIIATSCVCSFCDSEDRLQYIVTLGTMLRSVNPGRKFKHKFIFFMNEPHKCLRNLENRRQQYLDKQISPPPIINKAQMLFSSNVYNKGMSVDDIKLWQESALYLPVWRPVWNPDE